MKKSVYIRLLIGAVCIGLGCSVPNVLLLLLGCAIFISFFMTGSMSGQKGGQPRKQYPYRPGIEFRQPNGRITTKGYAGRHPGEFRHWANGPNNVLGENIDLADWEDWRSNYYGK